MHDYEEWIADVGRRRPFGGDDRLGTANHIDEPARRRAAASIETGTCLSLARPLINSGPDSGPPDYHLDVVAREGPVGIRIERLEIRCHGLVNTHLDAINHVAVNGRLYGDRDPDDPEQSSVADLAGHGLFTRGVLADIPGIRGTEWVEPDWPVTGEEIEQALGSTKFEAGDALLLYMGRDRFEAAGGKFGDVRPGAGSGAAQWIADNRVSIVCWDFLDSSHPQEPALCIHRLIWAVGLLLVDNCDLSRVPDGLASRASKTGALALTPIAVPGGTGSAVTPLLVI
jgi:kynurenine formamidase